MHWKSSYVLYSIKTWPFDWVAAWSPALALLFFSWSSSMALAFSADLAASHHPKRCKNMGASNAPRVCFVRLICLGAALWLFFQRGQGFSSINSQRSLGVERERSGQAPRSRVSDTVFFKLSRPEALLLREIAAKSQKRDWCSVEFLLSNYTGTGEPIYAAGINAAYRCRKYQEGAMIYDRCSSLLNITHMPVFAAALKVFGKCGEPKRVREVWQHALLAGDLNKDVALARISAAADEADLKTAAKVVDLMIAGNVSVHEGHVVAAMRSCQGNGPNQHEAAKYFFDLLPQFQLERNVIAFSCLMRAYTTAPIEDVISAYEEMTMNIEPNKVFAESYLNAVFQGLRPGNRSRSPKLFIKHGDGTLEGSSRCLEWLWESWSQAHPFGQKDSESTENAFRLSDDIVYT